MNTKLQEMITQRLASKLMPRPLGVLLALTLAASCAPDPSSGGGIGEGGSARPAPISQATPTVNDSADTAQTTSPPASTLTLRAVPGLNISADPAPPPTTPPTILPIPDPPQAASAGGFAAVSAGWGYTCGLHSDGAAECWRWRRNGSEPDMGFPWSTARYYRAGNPWDFEQEKTTLGLDWDSSPQAAQPPPGAFVAVSAGRDAACGLRPSGRVECWGNYQAFADAPEGVFAAVSAGIEHACALRLSGLTECWGASTVRGSATTPPEGEYTDIATGDYFACALKAGNGEAECWGSGFTINSDPPLRGVIPPGRFTTIHAGGNDVCGLRENGTVECWARYSPEYDNRYPEYNPYLVPPKGEFTTINVSAEIGCGMRPDGKHECWGKNGWIFPVADGDFLTVGGGEGYWSEACGALRNGGVECWGLSTWTEGEELPETRRDAQGVFIKLSMGDYLMCGLHPNGDVECSTPIAEREEHPITKTPEGVFVDISIGNDHACGLRPDWSVECWGSEYYRRATPPAGAFVKVSASVDFTCGLRPSGDVECWSEAFPQSKILPPTEPLTTISAGWGGYRFIEAPGPTGSQYNSYFGGIANDWGFTCGLRPDSTVRCWGDPGERIWRDADVWPPILNPPRKEFLKVQTGRWHACGLRADGKIECWGNTNFRSGETDPPHSYTRAGVYPDELRTSGPQTYTALSVGGTYTCGLRSDGVIECWDDAGAAFFQQTGPFTAVSAGYDHQCGLHATGDIHCWEITPDDATPWKTQTYTPTPQ